LTVVIKLKFLINISRFPEVINLEQVWG